MGFDRDFVALPAIRTTFQRFAATGSDHDDHNNGYSRYWPRPAPTGSRSSNKRRQLQSGIT